MALASISIPIIPNPVGARTHTTGNKLQVNRTNHFMEEVLELRSWDGLNRV